ncbi:MAG TPA: autotransporter-associated beta strand repeat-containing protein, partial [Candidatus Paceibacterota bacterium]|nr:autotransporter-associated beta strand repeat-containing protein [Candidatus Paceibacterota bacterium]
TNGTDVVSVLKVGSGKLTLNGNNGYTGSTTVSAGTLAGSGTFLGPVTVEAGGTLSPGASLGTMGISNSLTLAGTLVMEVSRDGATLSSDRIVGLTSVTFGGTLIISNVGPSALQAGDSFQLFNLGSSQDFASIIVPALPSSTLAWSFDKATGVLSVVDNRPRLEVVVGANTLQFSWSAAGYRLQAQTNSLSTGLGNTWFDYPGGGASPVTVPINPANPTVFFRLSN